MKLKCTCTEEERHGETTVFCCNHCGIPVEEMWQIDMKDRDKKVIKEFAEWIHDNYGVGLPKILADDYFKYNA